MDYSRFGDIPDEEIKTDIVATEAEASRYEAELHVLMQNPVKNRVKIYMTEGSLIQRREFIEKLNKVLEYRDKHNKDE